MRERRDGRSRPLELFAILSYMITTTATDRRVVRIFRIYETQYSFNNTRYGIAVPKKGRPATNCRMATLRFEDSLYRSINFFHEIQI